MTLSETFVATAGSVTGREHRRAERDGQDGCAVVASDRVVAAIVTDGCGSGRSSEIGARVGALWLAALIEKRFAFYPCATEDDARAIAEDVTTALLDRLEILALSLDASGDLKAPRIEASLLFTFLAAVVTPRVAIVFGIGDGVVVVDHATTLLDPGPSNAPPYVAYGILGARVAPRVHFAGPAAAIDVLAVATDGVATEEALAELPAIAADPRYAKNASLLRKRLVVMSDRGAFSDDATIAVVQRRAKRSAA